jgi:hypothetical protein
MNEWLLTPPVEKKENLASSIHDTVSRQNCPPCHGLRTPNEVFFHRNHKLLGLGRQFGLINLEVFWVFSAKLLAQILVQGFPCPCFPLFNHYFYKKTKPLYPLNLGYKD